MDIYEYIYNMDHINQLERKNHHAEGHLWMVPYTNICSDLIVKSL